MYMCCVVCRTLFFSFLLCVVTSSHFVVTLLCYIIVSFICHTAAMVKFSSFSHCPSLLLRYVCMYSTIQFFLSLSFTIAQFLS